MPRDTRPPRRLTWSLALLSCSCVVSVGGGGRTPRAATTDATPGPALHQVSSLERGLAAIRAESLSADVHFLASDELEGRDTPSRGLRIAASYLRARVQQLGWQPGAGEDYFYDYELVTRTLWSVRTFAAAEKDDMRMAFQEDEDYVFVPRPFVDHRVTGEVVFVGAGRPEDLEHLDLSGRWALCRDDPAVHWRRRGALIRAAGAVGTIVLPAAGDETEPFSKRLASWTSVREGLTLPDAGEPGFPTLFFERHAAERLLTWSSRPDPAAGDALGFQFTDTRTFDGTGRVDVPNVCALWPGRDPVLRDEFIVATAHFDHVGKDDAGDVFNGADDNASGSSGLLALAEALAQVGGLRRSVLLMWVSGEEKGLLGSEAWTRDPRLPEGARVIANLNIDMIGRNDPGQVLMTPSRLHPEHNQLSRLVESQAGLEGFVEVGSADDYWNRSDHANFARHLSVPVVFLFTDVHDDYHQPSDTADKIDYEKAARVTRLALRVLFSFDAAL